VTLLADCQLRTTRRCVRPTSASLHTHNEHLRLARFPNRDRDLRLTPLLGNPVVSRHPIRFGGSHDFVAPAAFSSARRVLKIVPLTSLSRSWWMKRLPSALAHVQSNQESQDCFVGRSREETTHYAIRDAFPRQVIAPSSRVPFPTSSFSANVHECVTSPPPFASRRHFAPSR